MAPGLREVCATSLEQTRFHDSELPLRPGKLSDAELAYRVELLKPILVPAHHFFPAEAVFENRYCRSERIWIALFDPLTHSQTLFNAIFTRPQNSIISPAVVIVPTIEDATPLEPIMAAKLCLGGIASIYPENLSLTQIPTSFPNWEHFDKNTQRNVHAIKRMFDFLESRSTHGIDRHRMGIVAASFGAIMSPLVMATDQRAKSAVLISTAVDFPALLATSDQSIIRGLRRAQMLALGLSDPSEYQRQLNKHTLLDGVYFAKLLNPQRVMSLRIIDDTNVPTRYQKYFSDIIGEHFELIEKGPHALRIIRFVLFEFKEAVQFLRSQFYLANLSRESLEHLESVEFQIEYSH